jgi:hypothetical protein
MLDLHDPCPPAHLPPERLVVLGLLTPLLCGALACSFVLFPIPVTCFLAFFLLVGMKCLVTACWEGSGEVGLRFVVVEARSGRPIQGAKVVVLTPFPAESQETSTGPEGTASLVAPCQVVRRKVLCWTAGVVHFTDRWFKVTAEGYEGTGRECLSWHTGRVRDLGHADPPPIRVELKRLPATGKG